MNTHSKSSWIYALMLACLVGSCVWTFAQGNIDATDKYAWAENAGWNNFAPTHGGVTVHPDGANGYLSGYAWAQNTGWIRLGAGTGPYANTAANNYGVNMDANGNLSGYAWSEFGGWINFNPTHSQVTIDLNTGRFDGYAWSLFGGWISFKNDSPAYNVRTTLVKPSAPSDVSATDGTYTDKVRITWNAIDGADSYEVWRHTSNNSGSATRIASGITGTSYDDTSVLLDVTYYYWIKAVNEGGSSGFSAAESGYISGLPDPALDKKAVYCFYSYGAPESTYTHLWTINEAERDVLMTFPSWQYEGIAWYALPDFAEGSVPLYRLYEPHIRRHLYTINATEYVALEAATWNGEDVQYYVYAADTVSGLVPVYRFYHGVNQNHHFTIDSNEKETIIANPDWGYTYEGIAFYVFANPTAPSLRQSTAQAKQKAKQVKPVSEYAQAGATLQDSVFYDEHVAARDIVYNAKTGRWYLIRETEQIELIPVPGDYNGDGMEDLALYEQATGNWYIRLTDEAQDDAFITIQWGGLGFVPVSGDYSNNGISDLAVYHEETGAWYITTVDGKILVWGLELDESASVE